MPCWRMSSVPMLMNAAANHSKLTDSVQTFAYSLQRLSWTFSQILLSLFWNNSAALSINLLHSCSTYLEWSQPWVHRTEVAEAQLTEQRKFGLRRRSCRSSENNGPRASSSFATDVNFRGTGENRPAASTFATKVASAAFAALLALCLLFFLDAILLWVKFFADSRRANSRNWACDVSRARRVYL